MKLAKKITYPINVGGATFANLRGKTCLDVVTYTQDPETKQRTLYAFDDQGKCFGNILPRNGGTG